MTNKQLAKRAKALQKAFDDEEFIYNILRSSNGINKSALGDVFKYYLSTTDKKHKYTLDEIRDKLTSLCYTGEPVIDQRYYFQAYNGYCEESYRANGLDDISGMETKVKQAFELLEQELGKTNNGLGGETGDINRSFITSDPETLMNYALYYSPERLWKGPLNAYKGTPIIIGEKKTDYMMRIIEKKLASLPDITDEKKEEIREAGKIVSEAYGSRRPRIAIIPESEIENYEAGFDERMMFPQAQHRTIKELADEENPCWVNYFESGPNMRDGTRYSSIW